MLGAFVGAVGLLVGVRVGALVADDEGWYTLYVTAEEYALEPVLE
jgi:hypothetical protein